jgi:glycosyltransferase involved in cell wall biosynthesis
MHPTFSIILPTFNRAYVLWKAVGSVVNQTVSDWELLVVDDDSTDCTLRLLEEFRDPRIRVVALPDNGGPSAARNHGLALAKAPYVAYIDSDNTWHADFLDVMATAIREDEAAVLWYCGQHTTVWDRTRDGVWRKQREEDEPRRQYAPSDVWQLKGADANCIVHRRSLSDEIGGWDEQCHWMEDWDLFLRASLEHPDGIRWVPRILVEYRQVFGEGADGVCAQAHEDKEPEKAHRRYLLDKWGSHPDFGAHEKLRDG